MKELEIYLDIETGWNQGLTVFGFRSSETGVVQLVGNEITRSRVLKELPHSGKLYTYNGHCFDLARIRAELGLDLREQFDSWDLRWICQRNGICGGQKAIECRMGIRRETEGIDGMEAIYLWGRYLRGDERALQTLLRYNAEDLEGLVAIKQDLARRGLLRK
jgi:uncharacterized protein YprB with RNaseH-like and TPR domain